MKLMALRDYLEALMAAGVSPELPVCVPAGHENGSRVTETDRAVLAKGEYGADGAPGYAGLIPREGEVLVLTGGSAGVEQLTQSHDLRLPPEVSVGHQARGKNRT